MSNDQQPAPVTVQRRTAEHELLDGIRALLQSHQSRARSEAIKQGIARAKARKAAHRASV